MADFKSRTFSILLYEDTETYDCSEVIANATEYFEEFAYMKHDSDILDDGTPKKTHWHFVGRFSNARTISAVAEKLGIPANFVESKKGYTFNKGVRYLAHADDKKKFQYDWHDIETNVDTLSKFFSSSDYDQAIAILDYIEKQSVTSPRVLIRWAVENGCYSELRRGFGMWSAVMADVKFSFDKEIKR